MKKNEEYVQDSNLLVDRKSYESPKLIDLGKMRRMTLGYKDTSGIDTAEPSPNRN